MFGDVVAFDTTYSTNKYRMIFGPFTGKDNHGCPVICSSNEFLLSKDGTIDVERIETSKMHTIYYRLVQRAMGNIEHISAISNGEAIL
ncbi:protein FAR1-RELATED SEQUENCE 5-like [Salvia divinorum]|uniref:Protein FAR1-RELATED SEQUENCE 5-like n=1 Tax=Salvia divinorum TaxID=28513 RepID=A0ABD1GP43_SALDI